MVSQETNTGERVGVAEGPQSAPADDNTQAPLTLKQRLAAIRNECFGIGKEDVKMQKDGKSWTIKGHTVEAILSEVRPLFERFGVDVTPSLVERSYSGNRCDVIVDFTFERTDDSDEARVIRWAGAGTDNGDKAFAKAGTNALKEMLKKRFLITDRDDAKEETESVEHQTTDQVSRAELEKARESARANLEKWAVAAKDAFKNAASLDDVKALEREHKAQLTSPDMPDVTRAFFIDLIERRKKELA